MTDPRSTTHRSDELEVARAINVIRESCRIGSGIFAGFNSTRWARENAALCKARMLPMRDWYLINRIGQAMKREGLA